MSIDIDSIAYRFQRFGPITRVAPVCYRVYTPADLIGFVCRPRDEKRAYRAHPAGEGDSTPGAALTRQQAVQAGVTPYGERGGAAIFASRTAAARAIERSLAIRYRMG